MFDYQELLDAELLDLIDLESRALLDLDTILKYGPNIANQKLSDDEIRELSELDN